MKPLIDADVLLHEIGWSGEFKDKETGEPILFDWEKVEQMLVDKINHICAEAGGDVTPLLFLSNTERLTKQKNKQLEREGKQPVPYVPNFRFDVAKAQPYKGNRKNPKPVHFYNIQAYIMANYEVVVSENGYEADDEISIYQFNSSEDTIICTRDKDLRICPGWHYSWECGKQRSIGPHWTDDIGGFVDGVGFGKTFFYYQLLTGDTADHIPGLPGYGPAKAKKLLDGVKNEREMFEIVRDKYKEVMEDQSKEYFIEQATLLWIAQQRGVGYSIPH